MNEDELMALVGRLYVQNQLLLRNVRQLSQQVADLEQPADVQEQAGGEDGISD